MKSDKSMTRNQRQEDKVLQRIFDVGKLMILGAHDITRMTDGDLGETRSERAGQDRNGDSCVDFSHPVHLPSDASNVLMFWRVAKLQGAVPVMFVN